MSNVRSLDAQRRKREARRGELAPIIDINDKIIRSAENEARTEAITSLGVNLAGYVANKLTKKYVKKIEEIVGQEELAQFFPDESCHIKSEELMDGEALGYYPEQSGLKKYFISNTLITDMGKIFRVNPNKPKKALEYAAIYSAGFMVGSLAVTASLGSLQKAEEGEALDHRILTERFEPHRFAAGILYLSTKDELKQPMHNRTQPMHHQGLSLPLDLRDLKHTASGLYC